MIAIETLMGQDLDLGILATSKTHASGGTLPGHQISLSTFSTVGAAGEAPTATWDPDEIPNGSQVTTTIYVAGAAFGDFVSTSYNADLQGLNLFGYVSAANYVTVVLANLSGAAVNLDSGTVKVLVFHTR